MFFFNDEKKYQITFELDEVRKANFELALEKLHKTPEEAFDAFLALLISKALGEKGEGEEPTKEENKRLPPETIRSRIHRWVERKHSYPHIMIKAYFQTYNMFERDGWVPSFKMAGWFNHYADLPDGDMDKFLSVLRQMCSSSSRAYGNVFVYDRHKREVNLNEEYKNLIIDLGPRFLSDS